MLHFENRRIVSSFILVIVMFESFSIFPSTNGLKKKNVIKAMAAVGIVAMYKLKDSEEEEKKYVPVPILPIIALALKIKQEKESQYYIVDGVPKESLHFSKTFILFLFFFFFSINFELNLIFELSSDEFHTTGKQSQKKFKIHWRRR
jgi:hypothetical protein